MKYTLVLFLSLLPVTASAAPVHVTLPAAVSVTANADGFWTLAQAAALSGGTKDALARLASVVMGRVPLPGETRTVTRGDVLLKLRQAGLCPGTDAVVDGAATFRCIVLPQGGVGSSPAPPELGAGRPPSAAPAATGSSGTLVHTGDPVAIVVQDGAIFITARGEAREAGAKGQSIRVHRAGVMTDLCATVVDAQTVQLEM